MNQQQPCPQPRPVSTVREIQSPCTCVLISMLGEVYILDPHASETKGGLIYHSLTYNSPQHSSLRAVPIHRTGRTELPRMFYRNDTGQLPRTATAKFDYNTRECSKVVRSLPILTRDAMETTPLPSFFQSQILVRARKAEQDVYKPVRHSFRAFWGLALNPPFAAHRAFLWRSGLLSA
jgi:hypothetical protein